MSNSLSLPTGSLRLKNLHRLMRRCGVKISPEDFLSIVSNTYHSIEVKIYDVIHPEISDLGQPVFRDALDKVLLDLPSAFTVLDLGCGTGYASKQLLEICPRQRIKSILCQDLSSDMLHQAKENLYREYDFTADIMVGQIEDLLTQDRKFDLIMTNSVIHHIPNTEDVLCKIAHLVAPGGIYVMGHEPCNRFMKNVECLHAYKRWQSLRALRYRMRWVDPLFYQRLLGNQSSVDIPTLTSKELMRVGVINTRLTPQEIAALVDIHVPPTLPGDFHIGCMGFDPDELSLRYFGAFQAIHIKTYNTWTSPSRWARKTAALYEKFPSDGITFTAAWKNKN
jgi:ubiquinone/menaquinone biosynthesis C-methylase UbiE